MPHDEPLRAGRGFLVALGWALALLLPPGTAQAPPSFVAGDPARLKCRILRTDEAAPGSNVFILAVEVSNPGPAAAEPLDFEISGPKLAAPLTLTRVSRPHADRAGRAVPPGGKKSYWLQASHVAAELASPAARVTSASFFEGAGVDSPPVRIGAIRHETESGDGIAPYPVSILDVENRLAERADVVVELACDEPYRGRSLALLTLGPSEKLAWRLAHGFRTIAPVVTGGSVGAKVLTAKAVDWSVERSPADGRDPLADFAEAWTGWLRRPDTAPPVTGTFEIEEGAERAGGPPLSARASGTFRIDARTPVTFTPDAPLDAATTRGVQNVFRRAFTPVFRRPVEDVLRGGVTRECRGTYRVGAGIEGDARFPRLLEVRERRFGGWTDCESGGISERWTAAPLGDGYVIVRREEFQTALSRDATEIETSEYALVDGHVVPVLYRRASGLWSAGLSSHATLRLRPDAGVTPEPAPAEAAAMRVPEPVRKAWDAAYRYPARPATLTGTVVVESPANDALWHGHRKLQSTFKLTGFRGMLDGHDRWDTAAFDIDVRASDEVKRQLGGAIEDRFRLWAFRDFAGREPLDRLFASAVFAPVAGREETWSIANASWASVELRKGVIAAYATGKDLRRTIEYAKIAGTLVPVRIRTGDEELLATFTDLGGGWLFPATLEFRRVFGRNWGPEKLTFSKLKLVE